MGQIVGYSEKTLGDVCYRVSALPFGQWLELVELLGGFADQPIKDLLSGDAVFGQDQEPKIGASDLLGILAGIVGKLKAQPMRKLFELVGVSLKANDKSLLAASQDLWWPQHMSHLAPVLGLFLEVQFADFFEGITASLGDVKRKSEAPEKKEKN